MIEFLNFFNEKRRTFPMHLEIYYSKIMDWCITITKNGCSADYPKAIHSGDDIVIVMEQSCDMELCFAKAYVALKEWLSEFRGGY